MDNQGPFSLKQFTEHQEKVATKWADQIIQGLSGILYEKSLKFIYRSEVEAYHDEWKDVDPYIISKVIQSFYDAGWAHVKYFSESGAFHFYASADNIPQASQPDPTPPSEYEDSFEFTQEYETVQQIVTSPRWISWLRETGASDEAGDLIKVMVLIDDRLRKFDGG